MTNNNDFTELRRKAEHDLRDEKLEIENMSEEDILKTIHELHVHQIELEMQNEQLRNAQLELENSCNKYSDLFDFAPIGYFVLDKKGIITEVNLTGASLMGKDRNHLLKRHFSSSIITKDKDVFYLGCREVFKTAGRRLIDLKLLCNKKETFDAELIIKPITDSAGEVTHLRIAVADISARKKAEEQVKDLAKFPSENPFPVLRISKDGTVIYSNTPGEVLLDDWKCQIGQKTPREWQNAVSEALKSDKYLVKEVHCGQQIFSFTVAPVSEAGYVNLYGSDITHKRLAQEMLRQSEKKYRRLFNTMTEGFALHEIIVDEKGKPCDYRFIEVNHAFEELTGLWAKDIAGKTVREAIPDIEQYWIDLYDEVALTGRSKNFENYSRTLGKYYEVFAYCPAPMQFAVIFMDITERKQAEEELRQKNEDLTRFNKYAVGRELRMIELKKEINKLCGSKGEPPRYKVDFEKKDENEKSIPE